MKHISSKPNMIITISRTRNVLILTLRPHRMYKHYYMHVWITYSYSTSCGCCWCCTSLPDGNLDWITVSVFELSGSWLCLPFDRVTGLGAFVVTVAGTVDAAVRSDSEPPSEKLLSPVFARHVFVATWCWEINQIDNQLIYHKTVETRLVEFQQNFFFISSISSCSQKELLK